MGAKHLGHIAMTDPIHVHEWGMRLNNDRRCVSCGIPESRQGDKSPIIGSGRLDNRQRADGHRQADFGRGNPESSRPAPRDISSGNVAQDFAAKIAEMKEVEQRAQTG